MGGRAQLQRLRNLLDQAFAVKRLGQIGEDAALGGFHRIGNGAVRRQQNNGQRGVLPPNLVKQAQAVLAG